jgi:hypothetical protein
MNSTEKSLNCKVVDRDLQLLYKAFLHPRVMIFFLNVKIVTATSNNGRTEMAVGGANHLVA